MQTPLSSAAVHVARRARLAAILGDGIAIVPTAPERVRNRDAHYPYRYDSYFYYLTGFREPEAVLVLSGGAAPQSVLFCREKNPEREIWDGYRYGPEAARSAFGFDAAYAISELDARMPDLLADRSAVHVHLGADTAWDARVLGWINAVRGRARSGVAAPQEIHDVRGPLDEMRLIKDGHELALMRRAGEISGAAHRRAMQAARPGATNTKSRPYCSTSFAAAELRPPRIRRSSPAAPMPACCITSTTAHRWAMAICC
jgi:Xaa-Pro aminopeptidase